MHASESAAKRGAQLPLGDSPSRDYSRKLELAAAFAAPELRLAIDSLRLRRGACVIDAGCGTGAVLKALAQAVGPEGCVVAFDLAHAHAAIAARAARENVIALQADVLQAPVRSRSADAIWCANTINHLPSPLAGIESLCMLVRPGGTIAIAQSSFLPEMFFAWDAELERRVMDAIRRYYRERYEIETPHLAGLRALVGWMRSAGVQSVTARTFAIERISPLAPEDEAYLYEAIFRDTWRGRIEPYLAPADVAQLADLCDPASRGYALRRPDFHFLQTFTLVSGCV